MSATHAAASTGTRPSTSTTIVNNTDNLTDISGLRISGIFSKGRESSIRTLRVWMQERCIPHHRLGHFVYYDLAEVAAHIRMKLMVPPHN
jgi:hypothetical protein